MRIGSLFSGYGGLDLAVQAVLGGETVWHSEVEPAACAVLRTRFPGVPNLGDITSLDPADIPAVDVVVGGYPCQPFSVAGRQKGTDDDRHLWPHVARILGRLQPSLAIFENVAGHLRLGFDQVLSDLAALGFDAEWACVRASDIGAPHRRERLFILAWPTNASRPRLEGGRQGLPAIAGAEPESVRRDARSGLRQSDTPGIGRGRPGDMDGPALADAQGVGWDQGQPEPGLRIRQPNPVVNGAPALDWGPYGPAIRRWETILGRPAPEPTAATGRHGQQQLSARFVEWLMGLPDGWVSDVDDITRDVQLALIGDDPDLPRKCQLHMLGNGVVPQQGAYALRMLLERAEVAA